MKCNNLGLKLVWLKAIGSATQVVKNLIRTETTKVTPLTLYTRA